MKILHLITLIALLKFSLGWWENGHMLVAAIAKEELLEKNETIYKRADQLIQAMNPFCENIDYDFVEAAVWADDIKDQAMNFWDDWHYYDLPINPTGEILVQDPEGNYSNSIQALIRAKQELANDDGSINFQKALFIRYILHVIGDMHQPLHNCNFYNETYQTGDLGGNLETIIDLKGRTMNFHAYWDQGAQYLQGPGGNFIQRPLSDESKQLFKTWANELRQEFPRDSLAKELLKTDLYDWTNEAYMLARDYAYPLIYQQNYITKEYQEIAQKIVRRQVALGGYRLADFILNIYKGYSPKPQTYKKKQQL